MKTGYLNLKRLRSKLLVFLTHNMALPVLHILRKEERFPYSANELKLFANGTLGKDLIEFLERKNLQLLPYYARHDIKHILLEYDTTDDGEVCLQCFMFGNGHISFPVLATIIFGIVTMPAYWGKFIAAYKRGRKSIAISNWNWFGILNVSTQRLTAKINNSVRN